MINMVRMMIDAVVDSWRVTIMVMVMMMMVITVAVVTSMVGS